MNALDFLSRPMMNNNNIREMMQLVKTASNPGAMMQQLAVKNPQLRDLMNVKNPKEAFFNKCWELGVNPSEFLSQLK